jgi:hypothetical protein
MFSQSIATSQQSRNGQIAFTWPNRLHTSHSACGQRFSEWPISSHVLHWWYGQSDALLVLCLLELQAEHSRSGQLASLCPGRETRCTEDAPRRIRKCGPLNLEGILKGIRMLVKKWIRIEMFCLNTARSGQISKKIRAPVIYRSNDYCGTVSIN